jgi:hypothetical protein
VKVSKGPSQSSFSWKDKMNQISFEEGTRKLIEFFDILKMTREIEFILEDMIIPEFRDYYTPNIPYIRERKFNNEGGKKIFIKSRIIELEIERTSKPSSITVKEFESDHNGHLIFKGVMSLREMLYVYANPEGYQILEKVLFMVENTNWDKYREEKYGPYEDDDIPF